MRVLIAAFMFCCFSISASAGNMLHNSSFELGKAEFGVIRYDYNGTGFKDVAFDRESKIHGKQSLKVTNPGADTVNVLGREVKLIKGSTYTFSWYMKSDKPVRVRCSMQAGETKKINGKYQTNWGMLNMRYYSSTNEWKRYHFTFKAKGTWHFPEFRWGAWDDVRSDATLWIDALQLEAGDVASEYSPSAQVEAAFYGKERVQFAGADAGAELRLVNYSDISLTADVVVKTVNTVQPEKKIADRVQHFDLAAGGCVSKAISTKVKDFGHYKLTGVLGVNGGKTDIKDWNFAQVMKPVKMPVNLSRFAVGCSTIESIGRRNGCLGKQEIYCGRSANFDEYLDFVINGGCQVARCHGQGGFFWKEIEPEPGKYNWTEPDKLINRFHEKKLHVLPILGGMFYLRDVGMGKNLKKRSKTPFPKWVLDLPGTKIIKRRGAWDGVEPDHDAWRKFVAAFATHYRGKIMAYEITNEPNIAITGEGYAEYVKIAYEEIKKADPEAKVIGGCLTTDLGGSVESFGSILCREGAIKSCDAVSFHPYRSPLNDAPVSAAKAINNLRNQLSPSNPKIELWNTELYYLVREYNGVHCLARLMNRAHHMMRRGLIDLGENVSQCIALCGAALLMNELAPNWTAGDGNVVCALVPNEVYVAQSTLASVFTAAEPIKRLVLPTGANGYHYRLRGGDEVAAFWKSDNEAKFRLMLPDGQYELRDLFWNPIENTDEMSLENNPVFIHAKSLGSVLNDVEVVGEKSFELAAHSYVDKSGITQLAVALHNVSGAKTEFELRPTCVKKSQKAVLEADDSKEFFCPVLENGDASSFDVLVSDDSKVVKNAVNPVVRKSAANGENIRLNEDVDFVAKSTDKAFELEVRVKDSRRGDRAKLSPWNGDGVELFFDSAPLSQLFFPRHTSNVRRLFIAPASANGLSEHFSGMKFDLTQVKYHITDNKDNYIVSVVVPWEALGLKTPAPIGFDIKVNDIEKKVSHIWAGTTKNHIFRDKYGVYLP